MIETPRLKERQVELVRDEAIRDVLCESRMSLDRGQRARAAALVRHGERLAETEREVRVVIEEERRNVIVISVEKNVRRLLL